MERCVAEAPAPRAISHQVDFNCDTIACQNNEPERERSADPIETGAGRALAAAALIAGALAIAAPGVAAATTYDGVKAFQIKNNPKEPWSDLVTGTWVTDTGRCIGITGLHCWTREPAFRTSRRSAATRPVPSCISTRSRSPPDHLRPDPASLADLAVGFTVPVAGTDRIEGDFPGIDPSQASHPVGIAQGGLSIFSATIASCGQSDPFDLAAGDTIDVICQPVRPIYLSTGLAAKIRLLAPAP